MKTCFRCKSRQPLSEFYRHPKTADGHLGKCKTCTKSDTAMVKARVMADPVARVKERERKRLYQAKRRALGGAKITLPTARIAWANKYPERRKAQVLVGNAIRDGRLIRKPCEVCGLQKVDGHHPDYSKPLEVRWLCHAHHMELHRKD